MKKTLPLILLCLCLLVSTAFASSSTIYIDLDIQCKKPLKDEALIVNVDGSHFTKFDENGPSTGLNHIYSTTGTGAVLEDKPHTITIEYVKKGKVANTFTFENIEIKGRNANWHFDFDGKNITMKN